MDGREFLGAASGAFCVTAAGCLSTNDTDPEPRLLWVELENHRRKSGYEFTVRIEEDESTVFEATRELGPAGSGEDATVIENPVADSGRYSVHAETGDHSVTVETAPRVSSDEPCLGLQFYLGASALNAEHTSYSECE